MKSVDEVREFILSNKKPSYQTTNKKEVRVRCPYCGDSKSNPSDAHFYIKMNPPFPFHCFKCETSGVLTQSTLRDLGLFNSEVAVALIHSNKLTLKATPEKQVKYISKLKLSPINSEISKRNLQYFNNRYGSSYSVEEVTSKFKAITDAPEFFKINNLKVDNHYFNFENSIGFLSSDASHIIFRDTSGTQRNRYYNLNVSGEENYAPISKSYNISNEINLMSEKLTLVITEGIFDIIGVYHHFYSSLENTEDIVFAAACGKSYNNIILNYLHMGFLDLNIVIYSDGDVPIQFYQELKENSPYIKNSRITIYYNNLYDPKTKYGKDYGCPIEDIQLKKIII